MAFKVPLEYLQALQQGLGGLGQGMIQRSLMQREDKQREEEMGMKRDAAALSAGLIRAPEGTTEKTYDPFGVGNQYTAMPTELQSASKMARNYSRLDLANIYRALIGSPYALVDEKTKAFMQAIEDRLVNEFDMGAEIEAWKSELAEDPLNPAKNKKNNDNLNFLQRFFGAGKAKKPLFENDKYSITEQ